MTGLAASDATSRASTRPTLANAGRRRRADLIARSALLLAVVCALIPLAMIIFVTVERGLSAINLDFFIQTPPPQSQPGGGYASAIFGSLYMTSLAILLSVPLGIAAAVYLVEYRDHRLVPVVRFFTDVMTGVPSVFVGVFVFSALVVDAGLFFGTLPGAVALAILMLPIIVRSGEEVLRLVPQDLRNGAYALGARRWQIVVKTVLPAAASGLTTGIMLAIARGVGETAPLLFTALGSREIVNQLTGKPQDALPLQILDEIRTPFEVAQARGWAGALTLMVIVLILTVVARTVSRRAGSRVDV